MDLAPLADPIAVESDEEPAARATVKQKWLGAVTEGSGFVAVPMALLRLQSRYDLTATDMLVLINLLAHWWEPEQMVYPRSTTVAARMGVDKRTVQRSTQKMLRAGLITRKTLRDGKRAFGFEVLAKRLAKDVMQSYAIHRGETFGDE